MISVSKPSRSATRSAVARLAQRQQLEQFVAHALNRRIEQVRRVGANVLRASPARCESRTARSGAPRAARGSDRGRWHRGCSGGSILASASCRAARRVDHLIEIAAQINRQRVDGEIAVAQVGFEAVAAKARHVNREPTVRRVDQRAPHVALGSPAEERAVQPLAIRRASLMPPPGDGNVHVLDRAAQQRIAHRPADDVDRLSAVSPAGPANRARHPATPARDHSLMQRLRAHHADEGQVAELLVQIQPIAEDELVLDHEAGVIDRNVDHAAAGFVEQRTQPDAGGLRALAACP